jgi:hypothetical protein
MEIYSDAGSNSAIFFASIPAMAVLTKGTTFIW